MVVSADANVGLTNSINAADTQTLAVPFNGIDLACSNTAVVSETEDISVANIENALFGTWSGVITYDAEIVDVH